MAEAAAPDGAEAAVLEAEARLAAWKRRAGLDEAALARRLAADRLDRTAFARLLAAHQPRSTDAEPGSLFADGAPEGHDWRRTLWDALRSSPRSVHLRAEGGELAPAVAPFVAFAWDRLLARLEGLEMPESAGLSLDWPALGPQLQAHLARRLLGLCRPALVLDENAAVLEERLTRSTPQERFREYVEHLESQPQAWERVFSEYPVLARLVAVALERWVDGVSELLHRLASDWAALEAWRPGLGPARLVRARGGLSDPRVGSRSVWILTFAIDGAGPWRVVYKPRCVAVDAAFQKLLEWCNAAGRGGRLPLAGRREVPAAGARESLPPFRTAWVLPRERYGWTEHVAHAGCTSPEQVRRFHLREGALLALLHVLGAADLDQGSLVACGEHPVLVDLETLLHHQPAPEAASTAFERATARLAASLMRVGLRWSAGPGHGRPGERESVRHLPQLGGVPVSGADHVDVLAAGFEAMYRFLSAERELLASENGPLAALAEVEVRHRVRAEAEYARILKEGADPDNLRHALDREAVVDYLWGLGGAHPHEVIAAEKDALRLGEVPVFTRRPGSRDLWDGSGRRYPDFFPGDSLGEVFERLAHLGPADLEWQTWVLRCSLGTPAAERRAHPGERRRARPACPAPAPPADAEALSAALVGQAALIGRELLRTAVLGEEDATWIGIDAAAEGRGRLQAVGPSLHGGAAGIALFCAHLGRITGRWPFTAFARRLARGLARGLEAGTSAGLGGFIGEASQLYALAHLARVLREPGLMPPLEAPLRRLGKRIPGDASFDLMSGAAGTLAALLAVWSATGDDEALEVAAACGDHLVAGARPLPVGRAWSRSPGAPPLLGFLHGAAGIAWSLLRLAHAASGVPRLAERAAAYRAAAQDGLAYERSRFDPVRRNWPDLREASGGAGPAFANDWRRGAPGVALGRLLLLDLHDDRELTREVEIGVEATLACGFGANHSLTRGDLGSLLVVSLAARRLQRSDWERAALLQTRRLLAEIQRAGPRCAAGIAGASPGLGDGLAGIGYGLLALACPRLPLVLALAPPA